MAAPPFVLAVDPPRVPDALAGGVFAIGNFDGLHRGHKAVLERARAIAGERGLPAAVLTFEPHPSDYFGGPGTIFRLTPLAEKARLVERFGMDGLVALRFDAGLANLTAEAFVREILVERLRVGAVVAGYDFHFGKLRGGTPAFLAEAGRRHGFDVAIIPQMTIAGEFDGADATGVVASSTATRLALQEGDVGRAAALLGHPYVIAGTVRPGQRLGRTLGFPTANVEADPSCRLKHGIYAVTVEVDGGSSGRLLRDGIASWGRRPTVDDGAPLLETFLFDYSGDLYGREMIVSFVAFLRAEARFASLDAMVVQMHRDVARARDVLLDARSSQDVGQEGAGQGGAGQRGEA